MRIHTILFVAIFLPGCLSVYHHPDCEVDRQPVDWEDVTALGVPADQFEAMDASGSYDGEYDEGMGPVGVELTLDRGAGKPAWITSTPITIKKRSLGIGNSFPHMIVECLDGLDLPTVTRVTTPDGAPADDAELDVRAAGTAFVPLDGQYATHFTGEAELHEVTLPEWTLGFNAADEVWAQVDWVVHNGVLEDGTAGWRRIAAHRDDDFATYTRTVQFEGPE